MIIYNADINGELKSVLTENGKIVSVGENRRGGDIDACGNRLIPGLIDVHTHGCIGMDVSVLRKARHNILFAYHYDNGV